MRGLWGIGIDRTACKIFSETSPERELVGLILKLYVVDAPFDFVLGWRPGHLEARESCRWCQCIAPCLAARLTFVLSHEHKAFEL